VGGYNTAAALLHRDIINLYQVCDISLALGVTTRLSFIVPLNCGRQAQ